MQKGWILCQEVMAQVLAAREPEQDVVWDEAKAKVEAEWEDLLLPDRAEIVFVPTAEQRLPMLPDSLVIQ